MNIIKIAIIIFLLVFNLNRKLNAQDWTFQPAQYAFSMYESQNTQIPCSKIDSLAKVKDYNSIYISIRDAGIFKNRECLEKIMKETEIRKTDNISCAIAFYQYMFGDTSKLNIILDSFDINSGKIGDHCSIELFGFLNEWNQTINRLLDISKNTDGIQAELLISALRWRQYIYGKDKFTKVWYSLGKDKEISKELLEYWVNISAPGN